MKSTQRHARSNKFVTHVLSMVFFRARVVRDRLGQGYCWQALNTIKYHGSTIPLADMFEAWRTSMTSQDRYLLGMDGAHERTPRRPLAIMKDLHVGLGHLTCGWYKVRSPFTEHEVVADLLARASLWTSWSQVKDKMVDLFFVTCGGCWKQHNGFGVSALWHAAYRNNMWLLRALLEWRSVAGDFVDATAGKNFVLWVAAEKAHDEAVEVLLRWRGPHGQCILLDPRQNPFGDPVKQARALLQCQRAKRWSAPRKAWVQAATSVPQSRHT